MARVTGGVIGRRLAIRIALGAVAGAVVVMAATIVGWQYYADWRLGRVELFTDDEPLFIQVLAESSDTAIGEPFDLVRRAVVSLPAGDYRLRVSGKGRLGRTYRFAVNRGETQAHTISIDEGRLLGGERAPVADGGPRQRAAPILFGHVVGALELTPGKADFIERSDRSLLRRDGATGRVLWNAFHPAKPFPSDHDPARWMQDSVYVIQRGDHVDPAPDLDGDGTGDLIFYSPYTAVLLALSGKDGSMLWNYVAELGGPGGPKTSNPKVNTPARQQGFTAGVPAVADVDHDGTPDVCATFVFTNSPAGAADDSTETGKIFGSKIVWWHRDVVVAVSGRSGRCLWSHPVEPDFVESFDNYEVRPAALIRGRQSALLAFVNATQWLGLDLATGRLQAGPVDLGFTPLRPVVHADLDGDGEPEIVAEQPGPADREQTVRAFSIKTRRELWTQTTDAAFDASEGSGRLMGGPPEPGASVPSCPLVVDLDQDGRSEIVVGDRGPMPPVAGYRGVRLLDGRTGAPRWRRAMRPESNEEDGVAHIIAAPDLDGDGTRDVVTVSMFDAPGPPSGVQPDRPEPSRVYVDVLSGKDGHPLWWWKIDVPLDDYARIIGSPFWWGRGPDGWPLLAIPLRNTDGSWQLNSTNVSIHLLEASTGRERHTIAGLGSASLADLNGDGLADLWGDVDGEMRAFRGEAPEAWRALGQFRAGDSSKNDVPVTGKPVADLDRDGIADTLVEFVKPPDPWSLQVGGSHTALARSGATGMCSGRPCSTRGRVG